MTTINIKDLPKGILLQMMISGREIISPYWGLHQNKDGSSNRYEESAKRGYIDYIDGVAIKTDLSKDTISSYLYNRDAGYGKLERIVANLERTIKEQKIQAAQAAAAEQQAAQAQAAQEDEIL
jgi:hypothetical protein